MSIYTPTYLYIKRHVETNLRYLGKTIQDPYQYNGSGVYWQRHVAKHGLNIETVYAELFHDKDELVETALFLSELYNVVESPEWANLMVENGTGGGYGKNKSGYTVTEKVLEQWRTRLAKWKQTPRKLSNTKLGLRGNDRTEAQLVGRVKAQETRRSQPKTKKEIEQFNEFRKVGTAIAQLVNTGSKILQNPTTGKRKFAKPGSDKWNGLIEDGFIAKS